ncbi:BON domain-containing protein [Sphingomonas sp. MMS24-J13]|uniref:BON domain-containing protein n=1 Tax=Sphingomonas sp. MMS24-J13 TaxID=3238686 RepID=UPI00384A6A87
MKSDSQLQHDVMAELEFEPSLDHAGIGVGVANGVVTLSGVVSSYVEKLAAERAARRVAGVQAIAEDLTVRSDSVASTADPEIARRIVDVLDWTVAIPASSIKVEVEHGWVTLSGVVPWRYQSDAARGAAARIRGVVGVTNLIEVRQGPVANDVKDRIVAALKRSVDVDASTITVLTDGSKVMLGGRVNAWHERDVAERAAWAAPGVTKVEDNITVQF